MVTKNREDYFRAYPKDFIFVDKDGKKSSIEEEDGN